MGLVRVCHYPVASPGFVESLFHAGSEDDSLAALNSMPPVECSENTDHCYWEGTCLVATVVMSQANSYWHTGVTNSQQISLVCLDGSYDAFTAHLSTGMTSTYFEWYREKPSIGSTIYIYRCAVVRRSDEKGIKRAFLLIEHCQFGPSPDQDGTRSSPNGVAMVVPDFVEKWVDKKSIESIHRHGYLMFLVNHELENRRRVKEYLFRPKRSWFIQQNEAYAPLWAPYKHRVGPGARELQRLCPYAAATFDCGCCTMHGYERCLLIQYPPDHLNMQSIYDDFKRHVQSPCRVYLEKVARFGLLENKEKRRVLHWWYCCNLCIFGNLKSPFNRLPECLSAHFLELWPDKMKQITAAC